MSEHTDTSTRNDRDDRKYAAAGGLVAAAIGFGAIAVVGFVGEFEARRMLDSIIPTARIAASAYVGAGGTTLALMLTLLTFSINKDLEFRRSHYQRIREISIMATAVVVLSVLLLMLLVVPLGESDVNEAWHRWMFYAVLLGGAAAGGVFISAVMMLLYAVRGLIGVAMDGEDSELLVSDSSSG